MINTIYNFRQLTPQLATGGQPDAEELAAICRAGYQVVINLGLQDAAYALADEKQIVLAHGLRYYHLPVNFETPEPEQFFIFRKLYRQLAEYKCFIHCAANKRVSTFMALYRILELGWSQRDAEVEMLQLWQPNAAWRSFMQQVLTSGA